MTDTKNMYPLTHAASFRVKAMCACLCLPIPVNDGDRGGGVNAGGCVYVREGVKKEGGGERGRN